MGAAQYNDPALKKLLTAVAALVALIAVAFGVGSVRWRPAHRSSPPRLEETAHGAGPLLAGAATVALEPVAPVPIGGFPRLQWTAEGQRDPLAVRALALQEPGCTVALVSVEILLIPGTLQHAIERRVRDLDLDRVIVAATHTHAGLGGYWDDALGERLATGPYREDIFDHVVDRAALAVRQAVAALRPAYLSVGHGHAPALARNRDGGAVDGRLVAVRLVARSGETTATIVDFASHATLLGMENRRLSGDWPGALMRSSSSPLLFFQGAVGDQSPRMPPGLAANPELYAHALAGKLAHLRWSRPDPWPEMAVATSTAVLPPADPGAAPRTLRAIARNVFYDLVPARARVVALRLGPLTLIAVPAEPVAEVGRRWREAAGEGSEVLALAGEYLGYVETPERMAQQAGETVRTYYGPDLADRLEKAIDLAARAVGTSPVQRSDAAPQNRTTGAPRESHER